jgi:hypothetical protein
MTFYPRAYDWYGMSQYAYNYENRSSEYGCTITEIRLSRAWSRWSPFYNRRILIASYRQDPEHLDDYLMCDADNLDNTSFTVHFKSVQASTDINTDDSKRYSIKDANRFLADRDQYSIDLSIPLWVDQKQEKAFVIRPNKSTPEIVGLDYLAKEHPEPKNTKTITVMNHTSETLVARPLLVDKFSKLRKQYYIDQPDEIKPGETQQIKVALSNNDDYFDWLSTVRFNYYIQGHSAEKPSGCYITFAPAPRQLFSYAIPSHKLITSFLFDSDHSLSEKNLYCIIVKPLQPSEEPLTVIIDDDVANFNAHRVCTDPITEKCTSSSQRDLENGWTVISPASLQAATPDLPWDVKYIFSIDPIHQYIINGSRHKQGGRP